MNQISQPKGMRAHACFLQSLVWSQRSQVALGALNRFIQTGRGFIGQDLLGEMPPEMIHRIEFGTGRGQPPQLNPQWVGQLATAPSPVRRMAIQKEDDMPAPPMGPDQVECGLEVSLVELLRDRAEPMAAFDIQDSSQHPDVTGGDDGYGCLCSHRSCL